MPIGIPELLIILVILVVIFGPKRLPQLGRQLGSGMREFKDGVTGKSGPDEDDETPAKPELTRSEAADAFGREPDATRTPTGEGDEPATRRGP
jgi:sec-independent protein translocase protein TatA